MMQRFGRLLALLLIPLVAGVPAPAIAADAAPTIESSSPRTGRS